MITTASTEEKGFPVIPAGPTLLQVVDVETTTHEQYGSGLKWILEVVSPKEHKGSSMWYFTGDTLVVTKKYGKCKYWKFVEAVFGREVGDGEAVDTDDLCGRQVCSTMEIITKEGNQKNQLGTFYMRKQQAAFPAAGQPKPDNTAFKAGVAPEPDDMAYDPFEDQ